MVCPEAAAGAQKSRRASKPTDPARVQSEVEQVAASRTRFAERKEKQNEDATAKADQRAAAEERAEKCASYRQTLQKLVTSRRLYHENESGERVYLDEAEAQAARQRAEDQVNEYCNP